MNSNIKSKESDKFVLKSGLGQYEGIFLKLFENKILSLLIHIHI